MGDRALESGFIHALIHNPRRERGKKEFFFHGNEQKYLGGFTDSNPSYVVLPFFRRYA